MKLQASTVALALCLLGLGGSGSGVKPDAASETTALKPTPPGAPKVNMARQRQFQDYRRMTLRAYLKKYPSSAGRPPQPTR